MKYLLGVLLIWGIVLFIAYLMHTTKFRAQKKKNSFKEKKRTRNNWLSYLSNFEMNMNRYTAF